jgi:hypothetical protein
MVWLGIRMSRLGLHFGKTRPVLSVHYMLRWDRRVLQYRSFVSKPPEPANLDASYLVRGGSDDHLNKSSGMLYN